MACWYPGPAPRPCGERGCFPPPAPERPPCRPSYCADACRRRAFWPCWNTDELLDACTPRPCCLRCGCCEQMERQGRFVRCCKCGWIGFYEECFAACSGLRSCCDNLLWPHRPGEPR